MLVLFLPAGSLRYAGGWRLLCVLFLPMLIVGVLLLKKNPELLRKRLENKEQDKTQKAVIALTAVLFLAGFVIAGLDFRFGWLQLPRIISRIASGIFLGGYAMFAEVLREHAYLSRTVEVQEGQKVISTGLYGVVRHPMYSSTLFLVLSFPFILGSPLSFLVMLGYLPLISARMKNEEKVLAEGLEGYRAYCSRVKYRVSPFLW